MDVLPAPFGPSRAMTSPGSAVKRGRRRRRGRRSGRRGDRPRRRARRPTTTGGPAHDCGRHRAGRRRAEYRPAVIDVRRLRTDPDGVKRRWPPRASELVDQLDARRGPRRPAPPARGRAGRRPRAASTSCPSRSASSAGTARPPTAEAVQAESRALGERGADARGRGRRRRAASSATCCCASPTCRRPTRPTAPARTTTPSSGSSGYDPDGLRRAPAGAALGDRRRASASSTTSGR